MSVSTPVVVDVDLFLLLFGMKDCFIICDACSPDDAAVNSAEGNMDFILLQKSDAMAG